MTVLKVSGIILICLVSSMLLRNLRYDHIYLPVIAVAAVVLGFIMTSDVQSIVDTIEDISADSGFSQYITILFKALGISYLTALTSELCRNAGEESLSKIAEVAGKLEILALCIPMTTKLIETAKEMI